MRGPLSQLLNVHSPRIQMTEFILPQIVYILLRSGLSVVVEFSPNRYGSVRIGYNKSPIESCVKLYTTPSTSDSIVAGNR